MKTAGQACDFRGFRCWNPAYFQLCFCEAAHHFDQRPPSGSQCCVHKYYFVSLTILSSQQVPGGRDTGRKYKEPSLCQSATLELEGITILTICRWVLSPWIMSIIVNETFFSLSLLPGHQDGSGQDSLGAGIEGPYRPDLRTSWLPRWWRRQPRKKIGQETIKRSLKGVYLKDQESQQFSGFMSCLGSISSLVCALLAISQGWMFINQINVFCSKTLPPNKFFFFLSEHNTRESVELS